jgi:uncharacterized protein (TIGR02246 family)
MPHETKMLNRRQLAGYAGALAASLSTSQAVAHAHTPAHAGPVRVPADDKLDIIELMARYAWAYDTSDVAAFAATFTPDGSLDIFGRQVAKGREAMPAFLASAYEMRKDNGWQHLTDHHVFAGYDGASCVVYSYYLMPESDSSGGNGHVRAMGYYVSHCVKQADGAWLFARREVFRWNGKRP